VPAYAPLMVVAQGEPLAIVVNGDAPRVNELAIGQQVTVTHYLARDTPFAGEVVALPAQNSNPAPQPGFADKLQIAVADDHPPLKINDFVDITVRLALHADTLVLPNAAVRRFAGRTFVVMEEDGRSRRVDITTGLESGDQVEVLAGLEEGDVVIGP
jgi:multidrug efflux pump subunit AcrA (membrane-fusion protein)